ncbi:MAG: hypothetical protein L6R38_006130 [Xanthoria sp. 2 TBL-2021]|nr:MAG: hypothetical protein L6R38_006130 [Xanthoria sp. 2 TBL-2021]
MKEEDSGSDISNFSEGLFRLSTLPLTNAEVRVKISKQGTETGLEAGLWSRSDKDQVAQDLQKMLLDPKGAEIYAEAQRKAKEQLKLG